MICLVLPCLLTRWIKIFWEIRISGKLSLSHVSWFGWDLSLLPLIFWPSVCFILSLYLWQQVKLMFMAESAVGFIVLFQTGWFIESMWSQTMVIHMLRSANIPFLQSRPAWLVLVTTLLAAAFVTFLPYSPLASLLHLTPLKPIYFIFLIFIIILYMISVTIVKKIYIKKYKEWL